MPKAQAQTGFHTVLPKAISPVETKAPGLSAKRRSSDLLVRYQGCSLAGYALQKSIGKGDFAQTFAAVNAKGGEVAIKFLPLRGKLLGQLKKSKVLRALEEANRMCELTGTGSVGLVESFNLEDRYFCLVMPRAKTTLLRYEYPNPILEDIRDGKSKPQDLLLNDIRTFAWRMLMSLSAYEAKGLQHGDLKPSNIFLMDGTVNTATLGDLDNTTEVGQKFTRLPAPNFCAPEVIEKGVAAKSADVYSLGLMMLFMFNFCKPIFTSNAHQTVATKQKSLDPKARLTSIRESYLDFYINLKAAETAKPQFEAAKARPSKNFTDFSEVIKRMTVLDPSNRCSVAEALTLNFFKPMHVEKTPQLPTTPAPSAS